MTDPIRIPIELIQLGADGSASMAVITPDLARRIVALAKIRPDKLDQEWRDPNGPMLQPAPPVADDDAAVKALMDIKMNATDYACNGWGHPFGASARAILAAIKAGDVPGVRCDVWAGQTQEILAARGVELVALSEMKQERDKALADLAALTAQRDRLAALLRDVLREYDEDDEGRITVQLVDDVKAALAELEKPK